jgi:hypothetical protein
MVTPPLAKALGGKGWKKKDIIALIMDKARVPRNHHARYYDKVEDQDNPDESIPIYAMRPGQPAPIQLFVAGGPGTRLGLLSGSPRPMVTKKAELPANWDKLVAKYKDVVPVYARY